MPSIMARAKGGPVTSGSPYMVGEKGPELFVPFQSGQIVPTEVIAAAAATRDALRMPAAQVPFQGSDHPGGCSTGTVPGRGQLLGCSIPSRNFQQRRFC
jgi:hypothetical protein